MKGKNEEEEVVYVDTVAVVGLWLFGAPLALNAGCQQTNDVKTKLKREGGREGDRERKSGLVWRDPEKRRDIMILWALSKSNCFFCVRVFCECENERERNRKVVLFLANRFVSGC